MGFKEEMAKMDRKVAGRPILGFRRNRIAVGILGIALGIAGIHKFYLGRIGWGFIYVILMFTGGGAILTFLLGLIEGIMYLKMSNDDFDYLYPVLSNDLNDFGYPSTPRALACYEALVKDHLGRPDLKFPAQAKGMLLKSYARHSDKANTATATQLDRNRWQVNSFADVPSQGIVKRVPIQVIMRKDEYEQDKWTDWKLESVNGIEDPK